MDWDAATWPIQCTTASRSTDAAGKQAELAPTLACRSCLSVQNHNRSRPRSSGVRAKISCFSLSLGTCRNAMQRPRARNRMHWVKRHMRASRPASQPICNPALSPFGPSRMAKKRHTKRRNIKYQSYRGRRSISVDSITHRNMEVSPFSSTTLSESPDLPRFALDPRPRLLFDSQPSRPKLNAPPASDPNLETRLTMHSPFLSHSCSPLRRAVSKAPSMSAFRSTMNLTESEPSFQERRISDEARSSLGASLAHAPPFSCAGHRPNDTAPRSSAMSTAMMSFPAELWRHFGCWVMRPFVQV